MHFEDNILDQISLRRLLWVVPAWGKMDSSKSSLSEICEICGALKKPAVLNQRQGMHILCRPFTKTVEKPPKNLVFTSFSSLVPNFDLDGINSFFSTSHSVWEIYLKKRLKGKWLQTNIYLAQKGRLWERERCEREGLDQIEFLLGINFQICHQLCIRHPEYISYLC